MSLINYHPGPPPTKPKAPGRSSWLVTKGWYQQRKRTYQARWNHWYFGKYLKSDAWKLKAESVKARDGYTCLRCRSTDRLNVHHKTYKRVGFEPLSDLETLCKTCHGREHGRIE